MVFRNLPLVLSACSLVLGALLFALAFTVSPPGDSAVAVNYAAVEGPLFAVLGLDEPVPERETAAALSRALNLEAEGREILSESSQWVLLNDFDKIIQVPLDQYEKRLETFDPRNDGFAERLRSFFVRNGKRYFFIPLDDSVFRAGGIFRSAVYRSVEKAIRELLKETPYTLIFPGETSFRAGAAPFRSAGGHGGLYGLYLLCYLLAALGLCLLFRPRLLAFHLVLPLAGLSLLGSPGFAMGAILCLLAGLLLEPMREFCFSLHHAGSFRRKGRGFLAGLRWNGLVPYRSYWIFSFLLVGLYILSAVLGKAGPLLGAGSFVAFAGIFFAYFMTEAGGRGGHILFVPVIIIKNRAGTEFPKTMLPFACASLVSALLSFSSLNVGFDPPGILARLDEAVRPVWSSLETEEQQAGDWPPPIGAEEYRAHVLFQTGFSLLPLGSGFTQPEYFRYDIGQDGLIADVSTELYGAELYGAEDNIPPFLLEGFMTFLEQQVYTEAAETGSYSLAGLLPALCTLVICIPAFTGSVRRGGGRRKPSLYNDKRIAA